MTFLYLITYLFLFLTYLYLNWIEYITLLITNMFISFLNLFISFIDSKRIHSKQPLKEHSCKFKRNKIRNATPCNNCDDLLHLSFTLKNFNIFGGLWWSFYWENSKSLSIFTKKLHCRYSLGLWIHLCFLKNYQTFCFFKVFRIIRLLKSFL